MHTNLNFSVLHNRKETNMPYELVVVWDDKSKDVWEYASEEGAEQAGENMRMALGNQIAWCGTRPKLD